MDLKNKLFHKNNNHLSINAKWLYVKISFLISESNVDFVSITNEELAKDCNMSLGTFKRAKKELLETDLIQHWHMHFVDTETGKKSEKKISAYRIL